MHVCPTGIDIREGPQLECINCGLCVDACNHLMQRTGGAPWLIGWDTLAGQKARAAGRRARLRLVRPRTVLYAAAMSALAGAVLYGFNHRSTTNFSAIHDRAPLFVRLRDGGVRNGYTLKVANKTQTPASYTLLALANEPMQLGLPEQGPGMSRALRLEVPASQVGTFRLMLQGTPAASPENVTLRLVDERTHATRDYPTLFLSASHAEE